MLEVAPVWDLQHLYFWGLLLYPVPQLLFTESAGGISSERLFRAVSDSFADSNR